MVFPIVNEPGDVSKVGPQAGAEPRVAGAGCRRGATPNRDDPPDPLRLAAGQVDLWFVPLDGFGLDEQQACLALLSPGERERERSFRVESARLQYLAARGLVRTTLSRYAGLPPGQWRFTPNSFGRPFVDAALGVGDLFFSLSHTDGLVVCAVGIGREIGVDVERCDRAIDHLALARSSFAPEEAARLERADAADRAEVFFALWTAKEAYVKARGLGLSLPLDGFWIDIEAPAPRIHFTAAIFDDPERWRFRHFRPTPEHRIAVAAAVPASGGLTIVARETRPINLPQAGRAAGG